MNKLYSIRFEENGKSVDLSSKNLQSAKRIAKKHQPSKVVEIIFNENDPTVTEEGTIWSFE